ncbi:MAG: class IV adenylate cyclase [Phycisphaerales bacterium]|nr:class IV adenylate cyclase [Phycisphaerales bacterium]MCI0631450.1 class IV adenylate cyclase [Phycisphaerales bacterium]MCI0676605.1 class IV adenylate cyclase [Phycisphaerales bacterium]
MQNIEFKAELRQLEAARSQCRLIGAQRMGELRQTDTYYRLPDGRLKKREAPGEPVEWIFYHRPDRITPRMSNYTILNDDQARKRWGTKNLTPWLKVIKTRELWMIDQVRIHIDQVDELGAFIEFEAIVSRRFDVKMAHDAIGLLREKFRPVMGEPIAVGYSDLMEQQLADKPVQS